MKGVSAVTLRVKSAVLWGAIGFLSVLVLVQSYAVVAGPLVSIGRAFAIALLIGAGAGAATYALEHRVAGWAARRANE